MYENQLFQNFSNSTKHTFEHHINNFLKFWGPPRLIFWFVECQRLQIYHGHTMVARIDIQFWIFDIYISVLTFEHLFQFWSILILTIQHFCSVLTFTWSRTSASLCCKSIALCSEWIQAIRCLSKMTARTMKMLKSQNWNRNIEMSKLK